MPRQQSPPVVEHEKLSMMTPEQFANAGFELFDGGASFSSVEHSGLRRYGEAISVRRQGVMM